MTINTDPMPNQHETHDEFCILVNTAGQHSLWPSFRGAPPGWTRTGPHGSRHVCLEWIAARWTDIRPRFSAKPELSPGAG